MSGYFDHFFGHYDRDGKRLTEAEWRFLHERDPFYYRVAMSHVGGVEISTVLLPFNHDLLGDGPPMIFETMVFGGELDQYQERYSTELEALSGHEAWVQRVHALTGEPVTHWKPSDG